MSQNGLKQHLKCEKTPSLHYSQSPGFLKGRIKYYLYPLYYQRRGSLTLNSVARKKIFIHGGYHFIEKIFLLCKRTFCYILIMATVVLESPAGRGVGDPVR